MGTLKSDWTRVNIKRIVQNCAHVATICPGSSDPLYIVTYYIKCVTTAWTHSMYLENTTDLSYQVSQPSLLMR